MRKLRVVALALLTTLAVSACSSNGAGDVDDGVGDGATTLADVTTTLADSATTLADDEPVLDDVSALIAEVQGDMITLANQIQNSEADEDLAQSVTDLQAQLNEAFIALLGGGEFDSAAVQSEVQSFSDALDAAGDAVGDDIRSTWDSIRSQIDQIIAGT